MEDIRELSGRDQNVRHLRLLERKIESSNIIELLRVTVKKKAKN
jgi:hypothetical protein